MQPAQRSTDEIDLIALLDNGLRFLSRFRWILLSFFLAGSILGLVVWASKPTVYKSRMILHSFTLSNEDLIQVCDNYNRLLGAGEYAALAKLMQIDVATIGRTKQIKASQIQKVFTASNPNGFYIDVFVTDNHSLPELQRGILNGFENIDFIKRQLEIKKQNYRLMIANVQYEIARLDSTRSEIERTLKKGHAAAGSLIVDISGLNKQLIELNEKLLGYKMDSQFLSAVQVLQGFSAFEKPAGPHLAVWLGLGIIGGLGIGYITALFLSAYGKIRSRKEFINIHQRA